ncbi:MAG: hypothetical protein ACP5OS_06440 [Leptospirillia bacterium]
MQAEKNPLSGRGDMLRLISIAQDRPPGKTRKRSISAPPEVR